MELQWFTDYLFLRKQIVQFNGVLSEPNPINTGVPQGTILGPLRFLIFFNDVHSPLRHCKIITHADDTVIFTSSRDIDMIQSNLSQDLGNLSNWLKNNNIISSRFKLVWLLFPFFNSKDMHMLVSLKLKSAEVDLKFPKS